MATTSEGHLQSKLRRRSLFELWRSGIRSCSQKWEGEAMASLAEKIILPSGGVEVIEAMAARRAILLAVKLGFQKCIIEGDSEIVFKVL